MDKNDESFFFFPASFDTLPWYKTKETLQDVGFREKNQLQGGDGNSASHLAALPIGNLFYSLLIRS